MRKERKIFKVKLDRDWSNLAQGKVSLSMVGPGLDEV